jgi:hypothetical protein
LPLCTPQLLNDLYVTKLRNQDFHLTDKGLRPLVKPSDIQPYPYNSLTSSLITVDKKLTVGIAR